MTPLRDFANSIANADLPLAVGPAISTTDFCVIGFSMDSILVLIASPNSGAISHEVIQKVGSSPRWLDQGTAAEFTEYPIDITQQLENYPFDVNIVPIAGRRKKILLADMDSTMIHQECIDELGVMAGAGERVKEITARAMSGELDFEHALRARVALLKGLEETVVGRVINERITFMHGAKTLMATMKINGAYTALVSSGFTDFTSYVAGVLGFDEHHANRLLVENGQITGQVAEPILGKAAKLITLEYICATHGLVPDQVIAVGDGANDIPMLVAAGMGVAIHAKPHVQLQAQYVINHGDLTALLFLQGYKKSDFCL